MLATHDIKNARRVLAAEIHKGASPHHILTKLRLAISGLYKPRNKYSTSDFEVAFLVKSLGGPRLLYTLHHSHNLPSTRTVNRKFNIPRLRPSVGHPSAEEINANISAFFSPNQRSSAVALTASGDLAGNVLMCDGVAIDEKCRYDPESGCAIGTCREHPPPIFPPRIISFKDVEQLEKALHTDKTSCYGKEATVVVIAPASGKDKLGGVPLAVSSSCKSESGSQFASWLREVINAWHTNPCGERIHGPIWTIATDGESSLRVGKYLLCMSEDLDRDSPLGKLLYPLRGLNCRVGSGNIVATCDPKHVFKSMLLFLLLWL